MLIIPVQVSETTHYTLTAVGVGGVTSETISIKYINKPPWAEDDFAAADKDSLAVINVLTNNADVDGDALAIVGFTQAASGVVADNGDGSLTYTAESNFNGRDAFHLTAACGNGGVDTG